MTALIRDGAFRNPFCLLQSAAIVYNSGMSDLIGIRAAQQILKISKSQVHKLIQSGRLPATLLEGRYLLSRAEVETFGKVERRPGNPNFGRKTGEKDITKM